jgi:hypothetical protein
MAELDDNLALCYEAVRSGKAAAPRSANQYYFKSSQPKKDTKRHEFLLGATRGSNYRKIMEFNATTQKWEAVDIYKDAKLATRRKLVQGVLTDTTLSRKQQRQKIDGYMQQWGKDYFWGNVEYDDGSVGTRMGRSAVFENQDRKKQKTMMAKYMGESRQSVKDVLNLQDDDPQKQQFYGMFMTFLDADSARRFGVGNCDEKASLAAEYIVHNTPGGKNLAVCSLEEEFKGATGWLTGAGGDHVFLVYGLDQEDTSVSNWGPNAVIVDGWMNDAYPAQHHLEWKYGYNYKGQRINLKQFTVRNMVCVSYRNHIDTRYFWHLKQGKDAPVWNTNPGYRPPS